MFTAVNAGSVTDVDGFIFRYPDNDSDKAMEASHGDPAQETAEQQL